MEPERVCLEQSKKKKKGGESRQSETQEEKGLLKDLKRD